MNPWTGLIKKVAPVRPAAVQPRSYYALGLLKHGALTLTEFRAITGWGTNCAAQVLLGFFKLLLLRRIACLPILAPRLRRNFQRRDAQSGGLRRGKVPGKALLVIGNCRLRLRLHIRNYRNRTRSGVIAIRGSTHTNIPSGFLLRMELKGR